MPKQSDIYGHSSNEDDIIGNEGLQFNAEPSSWLRQGANIKIVPRVTELPAPPFPRETSRICDKHERASSPVGVDLEAKEVDASFPSVQVRLYPQLATRPPALMQNYGQNDDDIVFVKSLPVPPCNGVKFRTHQLNSLEVLDVADRIPAYDTGAYDDSSSELDYNRRGFFSRNEQGDAYSEVASDVGHGSATSSVVGNARRKLTKFLSTHKQSHVGTDQSVTSTVVTQKSCNSKFLGNASSKVKALFNTNKKSHPVSKHQETDQRSVPDARSESGGHIPCTKTCKYRKSSKPNKPQDANQTKPLISSAKSRSSSSTEGEEARATDTVKTKSSKSKKKSSKKAKIQIEVRELNDLPWSDKRPGSHLRGRYSGPVDESLLAHGKGMVVLEGNESLQCFGLFEHGSLTSTLECKNIKDSHDTNLGEEPPNASAPHTFTYSRKISQEPDGMLSDDIPSNQTHTSHVPKMKVEKKNNAVQSSSLKRRSSIISCPDGPLVPDPPVSSPKLTHSPKATASQNQKSDIPASPPRRKYSIGDIARTPRDMIIHKCNNKATHSASLIKQYDQAFLKRSNGLWTAAILADRSMQPKKDTHWYNERDIDPTTMELEESMLFVINRDGATKMVQKRHWGKFVRRMNM